MPSSPVKSILMVEDERAILELVSEELRELGFTVHEAETAEDGLKILQDRPDIDLLFTDIRLPGKLDGWDLAERARDAKPDLKIIYATGYSSGPSRIAPRALFFKKPYNVSAVLDAIATL